jgi:hypothetical protein
MVSSDVKSHVLNRLMTYYNIHQSAADKLYDNTYNLYHELRTLINFTPLKLTDEKILSSLIIMIRENIELNNDSNRYAL